MPSWFWHPWHTRGCVNIFLAVSWLKLYNLTYIIVYCEVKITLELFSPNFPDKLGIKNMFVLSFHLVCWKRSFDPISEIQTTALNQGSFYTSSSIEPDKTVNKKIKKSKLVISMKYIVQVRIIYLSPALPNIIYRKLPITLDDTHAQLGNILFEKQYENKSTKLV